MTNLNQQILKFDYDQNFKDQDFYVSNSNEHSFSLLNSWPKWDKNFINLIGEKFSGKSHLINIFLEKHRGIKINAENLFFLLSVSFCIIIFIPLYKMFHSINH